MRYPLQFTLTPSRQVIFMIAAIHLIAAIAFLLLPVSWWIKVPVLLILGASFFLATAAEREKLDRVLILDESGSLAHGRKGFFLRARPQPGCVDLGWAIWLRWQLVSTTPRRRPISGAMMLLPDNIAEQEWRSLRVWLRHCALSESRDQ